MSNTGLAVRGVTTMLKRISIAVTLACLALWPTYTSAQGGLWETYMAAATKAYQQGNYPEAEKQLGAALKESEGFGPQDPRLATNLNNLGELYRLQGRYAEAEQHYKWALAVLEKALRPFDVWITGRKRFQDQDRAQLDIIESDETHVKINPLVLWEKAEVEDYFRVRGLPRHPMVEEGYPSIGCAPCTRAIKSGESLRAGRWSESEKTECGIHKVAWAR